MFRKRLGGQEVDTPVAALGDRATAPPASPMRALDPRLLHRTRAARPLLAIDARARRRHRAGGAGAGEPAGADRRRGVRRRAAARARDGVRPARDRVRCCGAGSRGGWRSRDGGPHGACCPSCGWRSSSGACARSRWRSTAPKAGEIAAVAVDGIEALEGYFARYLPQAVLASVVPLLVIAWVAFVDLQAALIMLLTLAAGAGVHVAHRPLHRAADARALAGAAAAVDALPRRRARPADAAGVRPRRGAGGRGRATSASATGRRPWRRCASASCRGPCSSWRPRSGSRSSR